MYRTIGSIINQASSVATMNYFKEVFNGGPEKMFTCMATAVASALSTFFLPIWTTILAVCILILIDMILGTKVSLCKGEPFQSRKLWSTLKKFGWSSMAISCAHLMDTYIIVSFDAHLVELFAGMIGGVELWSMLENLQTLDPTGPWKIFSKVLKTKGERYLDITIEKEDLPKIKKLVKKIK